MLPVKFEIEKGMLPLRKEIIKEWKEEKSFWSRMRKEFDWMIKRIDAHPFLVEIEKGVLPKEKYKTYAIQNLIYFNEAFRNHAIASATAADSWIGQIFYNMVSESTAEYNAFVNIIKAFGIPEKDFDAVLVDPSLVLPSSSAYIDFQFKVSSIGTPGEIGACYLPCALTYGIREIGGCDCPHRIAKGLREFYGAEKEPTIIYGNYARSAWHHAYVKACIDLINFTARTCTDETRKRIKDTFRRALEYEYRFWDAPYRHDPTKEREIGSYF
jgi:thiaminase (transcriptional activator TenA)